LLDKFHQISDFPCFFPIKHPKKIWSSSTPVLPVQAIHQALPLLQGAGLEKPPDFPWSFPNGLGGTHGNPGFFMFRKTIPVITRPGKLKVCELENGLVEIVDLPFKNGWIFHSYVKVYQRVPIYWVV
jgi:hypothetical protein